MHKVIITGGNGFIGKYLQVFFNSKNIEFNILTRTPKKNNEYQWDIENNFIDENVFKNVTAIIHLAGENVGTAKWTKKQKQIIIDSRVKSTALIHQYLSQNNHQIKIFIGASGVGIYGDGKDAWQTENTLLGNDFLANVCIAWEDEMKKIEALAIRTAIVRTGVVLAKDNGALQKIIKATKYTLGTYFADGMQYMPWIHIDDIVSIYYYLLTNEQMAGIFNAVAPNPITNKEFTEQLSSILKKPMLPFGVPAFLLQIALGEMSAIVLNSNRCSADKIIKAGYQFQYNHFEDALNNLLKKN